MAHKRFCIYTIPNTLILPLKWFCQHPRESMKTIKVYGQIEYGQELDLKDFLAPNSPEHPDDPNNCRKPNIAQLRLSGVVIHRGGIGEGHYQAYVQDRCKPELHRCIECSLHPSSADLSTDMRVYCSVLYSFFAKTQPALLLFLSVLCPAQVALL